ncbi:MAG: PRC-barrel domain-containing protein [Opitutaceae bacterium]|jgi:sporulation protein YlmC with PRC-barrel domain
MTLNTKLLAVAAFAGCASFSTWVSAETSPEKFGEQKTVKEINRIEIKNMQGERLGRIKEVAVDLSNGVIVEVLVVSGDFLGIGGKIVGVPPLALTLDPVNQVYLLDVSTAVFKSAPAIDRSFWQDAGQSERIAAAYRHFGQQPYFLEEGEKASKTASRPKVSLGYIVRSTKITGMPVTNLQNEKLGKVWSMKLNIIDGRVQGVIIVAPDTSNTKSVVPAMALRFNAARDTLLLDDSIEEFANEPRYSFTEAANGQVSHSKEESYEGPRTSVALEQGVSNGDVDRTARINRRILGAKVAANNVQIGTINGRVTLRGWVNTESDRQVIGDIAIAASRLELVDNQITVGKPVVLEAAR